MKNKLAKIYNIFKQIENMNGSTGWDQTEIFYYYYNDLDYVKCWQLLYELFCENRNINPNVFGISLTEVRQYSTGISLLCEFGNSEEPIVVKETPRNGKNQPSGTMSVVIDNVEKELEFVDGINVSADVVDDEIDYSGLDTTKNLWTQYLSLWNGENSQNPKYKKKILQLCDKYGIVIYDLKIYLIDVDNLILSELMDIDYVSDRLETHFEGNDNSNQGKYPTFQIASKTPDTLYSLEEVSLFLNYLEDDCELTGKFHPDDQFDNYIDSNNNEIFTDEQQALYNKYLDDIDELDSNGDSIFVEAGFKDIYDYCLNRKKSELLVNVNDDDELEFTAYLEDGCLSIGIKCNHQFDDTFEDFQTPEGTWGKYLTIFEGDSISYPEYNLVVTWDKYDNSWHIESIGYEDTIIADELDS